MRFILIVSVVLSKPVPQDFTRIISAVGPTAGLPAGSRSPQDVGTVGTVGKAATFEGVDLPDSPLPPSNDPNTGAGIAAPSPDDPSANNPSPNDPSANNPSPNDPPPNDPSISPPSGTDPDLSTSIPADNIPVTDTVTTSSSTVSKATTTSTNNAQTDSTFSGLGVAGFTGLMWGLAIGIILLIIAAFLLYRRRRKQNDETRLSFPPPPVKSPVRNELSTSPQTANHSIPDPETIERNDIERNDVSSALLLNQSDPSLKSPISNESDEIGVLTTLDDKSVHSDQSYNSVSSTKLSVGSRGSKRSYDMIESNPSSPVEASKNREAFVVESNRNSLFSTVQSFDAETASNPPVETPPMIPLKVENHENSDIPLAGIDEKDTNEEIDSSNAEMNDQHANEDDELQQKIQMNNDDGNQELLQNLSDVQSENINMESEMHESQRSAENKEITNEPEDSEYVSAILDYSSSPVSPTIDVKDGSMFAPTPRFSPVPASPALEPIETQADKDELFENAMLSSGSEGTSHPVDLEFESETNRPTSMFIDNTQLTVSKQIEAQESMIRAVSNLRSSVIIEEEFEDEADNNRNSVLSDTSLTDKVIDDPELQNDKYLQYLKERSQ